MKLNKFIISALALLFSGAAGAERFAGGDISLLPEYENAGAVYKDLTGAVIPDLLPWLKNQGMNAMRVRLFVNPDKYKEQYGSSSDADLKYDPNACQDLEYITPVCKKIVENGMDLMLDFHYSDTWADPAKQWTPLDWQGLSDEQLYQKIYDYTKETLETLKAQGIVPAFIQPGNEISYGMLWGEPGTSAPKKTLMGNDANWDRLGRLLSQAIKACREVCPDAKIIIHTERVADQTVEKNFYDKMKSLNIDYDIIGLSYYPYFHGDLNVLDGSLTMLEQNYPDKDIMIVETGYSYAWEVPGTSVDLSNKWAYSAVGQELFATQLVRVAERHPKVDGLFWWWLEYNAYDTSLSGWYNAPLFDSRTGQALPALAAICAFATSSSGVTDIPSVLPSESDVWYDLHGRKIAAPSTPGLYIRSGKKILLK